MHKFYKWVILGRWWVVAKQHDDIIMRDIDNNLQTPKIYMCATPAM